MARPENATQNATKTANDGKPDAGEKTKEFPHKAIDSQTEEAKKAQKSNIKGQQDQVKMDVNEAHGLFNHPGKAILYKTMKHYGITPTGTLVPCNGCMLAKGRRLKIAKLDLKRATKPAQHLQLCLLYTSDAADE